MGMLSMMDAILDLPMGVVLEGLPLDPNTKEELMNAKIGHESSLAPIYRPHAGARGREWEDVTTLAKKLNLSLPYVNRAFNDSMTWAREIISGTPPRSDFCGTRTATLFPAR